MGIARVLLQQVAAYLVRARIGIERLLEFVSGKRQYRRQEEAVLEFLA